jgi:capsular polysaccharide biosynthesis protein
VIDPPTAQRISLTKPLADVVLRMVLGLVAGIIVAFLFEYLDDTVQDEADVQRWMGLPTLAVIPGGRQAGRARSA